MKKYLTYLGLVLGFAGCAAPIKEYYSDTFFEEDRIYQNKPLGFTLRFLDDWYLFTDPNTMDKSIQALARQLNHDASELLFVGATTDGLQGVRAVAAHLNASAREYAQAYYTLNKDDVLDDSGLVQQTIAAFPVISWEYSKQIGKSRTRFIEFFFSVRTYTIRIAFWADPRIFNRFVRVYGDIVSSIEFAGKN
jgi:hypothetical protein